MPPVTYLYDREHICFGSDVLRWARYAIDDRILYVQTHHGATYRYTGFPERVFNTLPSYASAGAWWNTEVKKNFYSSMSLGVEPKFRRTRDEKTQSSGHLDAQYAVVVEFTGPVEFSVRGDDVITAIDAAKELLEKAGFADKYKVKEVKKA